MFRKVLIANRGWASGPLLRVLLEQAFHFESWAAPAPATFGCDTETFALLAYGRFTLDQAESDGLIASKAIVDWLPNSEEEPHGC